VLKAGRHDALISRQLLPDQGAGLLVQNRLVASLSSFRVYLVEGQEPRNSYDTKFNAEPNAMNAHIDITLLQPVIALIAGILILIVPRLLNYVVAVYLILLGITGLWPHLLR
jgi:hypothetical protein